MADAGSLLGQLIGAALGGGGVRGGAGAGGPAGAGALGDILGQVLGGAQGGRTQGGAGGLPGGLNDILGQVLGGGQGGRGPAGQGGLPGGLGDILGQVLGGGGRPSAGSAGGGAAQGLPGGLDDILGQILGGGRPSGGGTSGGGVSGDLGDVASDALGGRGAAPAGQSIPAPAPVPAPAPQGGPEPAPQSGGNDLLKYGGIAVIGMLAWNAFRKWQAQSGDRAALTSGTPEAAGFHPSAAPGGADAFAETLLTAMAAAAQADGQLDADEVERIGGGLSHMGVTAPQRDALITFLSTPVDPQQVVNAATTPEAALQIYAASAMAIRPDSPAEQQYLATLASAVGIDPGLKAQIDADLNA